MHKGRVEAFSDGVFAIIITIMVLELRPPHEHTFRALLPLAPVFLSYVLSFIFVGIYWTNHHHMLQVAKHVSGGVLWANIHLLFWLSLTPFVTAWLGEGATSSAVAAYGIVLFGSGISYTILALTLRKANGRDSEFAHALGSDSKGWLSIAIYLVAIALANFVPSLSCALYVVVALMWLVPDRRFENLYH